jgi:hypothetical protein
MLTLSAERFQKIQKEAPVDCQSYLVQVTKYQAARNCKVSSCFWRDVFLSCFYVNPLKKKMRKMNYLKHVGSTNMK